jgi:hypothetical protein
MEKTVTSAMFLKDSHLIEFSVYPEGQRKICFIRYGVLKDHFGATPENAVAVLLRNMDHFAPVTIRVANRTPVGASVTVETDDF